MESPLPCGVHDPFIPRKTSKEILEPRPRNQVVDSGLEYAADRGEVLFTDDGHGDSSPANRERIA